MTHPKTIVTWLACAVTIVVLWNCAGSQEQLGSVEASQAQSTSDTASRIQSKIAQIGARATKIRESGGDVSKIQSGMSQVDQLLKRGDHVAAERILDDLLSTLGISPSNSREIARTTTAPSRATSAQCDPGQAMTVSSSVTLTQDCTIGGDLTVTGKAVLLFDYRSRSGARLVVRGNINLQDDASLQVEGNPAGRAAFVVDNEFNQQRSVNSRDNATLRLRNVEFHTQRSVDPQKGSVYTAYEGRGRSSLEVTGSSLNEAAAWLLANLYESATLTMVDSQHVPNEIYVHDSSVARIRGASTRTGVWLDAQGAKGTLTLPNTTGPFSWQVGAGQGLNVGWLLQVENAEAGLGLEVKPGTALTVVGNGARAPVTGELKISYFVVQAREVLDGLKAGLQNRAVSDRLTLKNVQLGPIAWQLYAGDNADLTIRNSVINEIGIFGRNARVLVERSVLQLAVLAALGPSSSLTINTSEIWNQAVEAANQAQVTISDSQTYGTLFRGRDASARISIKGGAFRDNPGSCTRTGMVDTTTGQPKCNPFSAPGRPRKAGSGTIGCTGTQGCTF